MKNPTLIVVLAFLCLFIFHFRNVNAQTAKVQIIHNAPDIAASTVDIYLDGAASPAIDDFAFRSATGFIDLPVNVTVGIAPGSSTGPGDIIANFPFALNANQNYVVVATGILPSNLSNYDQTANGSSIGFDLAILTPADSMAMAGLVGLAATHGATDVGAVDVLANGQVLIDSLYYGSALGYLSVPASKFVLDLTPENDNANIVASYFVDLGPLSGSAAVVFASGFLNPSANQNGAAFGLFAALPDGTVIPLSSVGSSRAQIIHNSADPGAATVDIYINTIKDTVKVDDFAFRSATPFIDVPAGYELEVVIAGPSSTDISDQVVATIPATFDDGESYTLMAAGVLNAMTFAANPDNIATDFQLLLATDAQETGSDPATVDIRGIHGATDAPTVDILANKGTLLDDVAYGAISGYLPVSATEYILEVTPGADNSTIVATYHVDLGSLAGGAAVVFASGFLDPASNQNGAAFGLFAALANGTVLELSSVGNARAQVIHNAADPGAAVVDVYVNTVKDTIKIDDFGFRTATPFLDLPTEYELEIVIAAPSSTGIDDQVVATIPATLSSGESYTIVANGLLTPDSFAVNPDGISTAFNLLVATGAQESALDSTEVDLRVFHGATDAPTVDVLANGGTPPIVSALAYTDFTNTYLALAPASYELSITPTGMNGTVVATFTADASGLTGGAGLILASGFLDPVTNQEGEGFQLILVLADGTVIPLPLATGLNELESRDEWLTVFPNPAQSDVSIRYVADQNAETYIRILDLTGKLIHEQSFDAHANQEFGVELSTDEMSAGIYHILFTSNKSRSLKRLVVVK
ncbi:MAG: DUF4397 domain-containing protein [Bacteroidota bacterium]